MNLITGFYIGGISGAFGYLIGGFVGWILMIVLASLIVILDLIWEDTHNREGAS